MTYTWIVFQTWLLLHTLHPHSSSHPHTIKLIMIQTSGAGLWTLIQSTLLKWPRPTCNHFVNNRFVPQWNTVQKLSCKRPLLRYFKRLQPLLRPEIWHSVFFPFPGKRPPGMIMYDCCKKVQFLIAVIKLADRLWQLTFKKDCRNMICR